MLQLPTFENVSIPTQSQELTPLMKAVEEGNYQMLQYLLKIGVKKDEQTRQSQSALHLAVSKDSIKMTTLLLKYGANPRLRDDKGQTPVHLSCLNPTPNCLKLLLGYVKKDALIEPDQECMTPIHLAVMNDNVIHLKYLLSKGIPLDQVDIEGKTPLHWCANIQHPKTTWNYFKRVSCVSLLSCLAQKVDLEGRNVLHSACSLGNTVVVKQLLEFGLVNSQDILGRSPLFYAAVSGHSHIIKLLLAAGADESITSQEGATALHYACSKNHSNCVKLLLKERNRPDTGGKTPLMWAALKGYLEVMRVLLEENVDPNQGNPSVLHICCSIGNVNCVALLLEYKANVNLLNDDHRTPIFLAEQSEICHALIKKGASINTQDKVGRTPLHWACIRGNLNVVSMFLNANANINAKDHQGKTPLSHACHHQHLEVVSLLLNSGATVSQDHQGMTVLHWAAYNNHFKILQLLLEIGVHPNLMDHEYHTALNYTSDTECRKLLKEFGGQSSGIKHMYSSRIANAWKKYKTVVIRKKTTRKSIKFTGSMDSDELEYLMMATKSSK